MADFEFRKAKPKPKLNSTLRVSGPDAESERSDSQIALGASDIFSVAMQQLEKSPVGSAANSKQTATKEPLRRIERQSWQQHVKMLLSF
jgi:hypothetical protein